MLDNRLAETTAVALAARLAIRILSAITMSCAFLGDAIGTAWRGGDKLDAGL